MKIVSIIGARPQFIKCGPVSRELRKFSTEILVHTGQHYDANMSDVFFRDLNIPKPDYNLEVGSASHAQQTAEMLKKIEAVILKEQPEYVVVYGDTNSTLAGAMVAAKLHVKVVHIEAGLRSFNRQMPEEINRIVTDHLSSFLFCPTQTAVQHLHQEGVKEGVSLVGDVMYDALFENLDVAQQTSTILKQLGLKSKEYMLATMHRAENTDDPQNLKSIIQAFLDLATAGHRIVFPAHPRTRKYVSNLGETWPSNILTIDPVSYIDMLRLESEAHAILTDSGGVQKEAYWLRVPCVTFRAETEWIETVQSGWNSLVGTQTDKIVKAAQEAKAGDSSHWPWSKGEASKMMAAILKNDGNG